MKEVLPEPLCAAGRTLHEGVQAIAPASPAARLRRTATELLRQKPTLIQDRIRSLTSHDEHLNRVAAQSYWHENGFAKIRFLRGTNFGVRLHVWPAGPERLGDVDPHGHRWAFASWIAAGEGVEETTFVDVTGRRRGSRSDTREYTRYEYGRDTTGFLTDPEPARLRVSSVRRHTRGDVYGCAPTVLHVVAPIGTALVATIVLQGPATQDSTPVYSRRGRLAVTKEEPIAAAVLRSLLLDVEAEISRTEPPTSRFSNRWV
jgi:hypothetical protein